MNPAQIESIFIICGATFIACLYTLACYGVATLFKRGLDHFRAPKKLDISHLP